LATKTRRIEKNKSTCIDAEVLPGLVPTLSSGFSIFGFEVAWMLGPAVGLGLGG
jgi:hypothetical protein